MQDPSQNFPITLIQGATFIMSITWYDPDGNPVDLTGYSARMVWRGTVQDTGNPIIDLSTTNGLITISGSLLTFTVPAATTTTLEDGQQMVYNLFITSPTNIVNPLMAGPSICQGSTIQ